MEQTHPVLGCLASIEEALKDVEGVEPAFMETDAKADALVGLTRAQARLDALRLRVLATADDVADRHGARDAASWLAGATRSDGAAVRRASRLATALGARAVLSAALDAGDLTTAHAHVIARALDDLPTSGEHAVPPDVISRAEAHLVEAAATFTPKELRVLGRRVLEVVAPEVADDHERRALEAEQARARKRTWLSTHAQGDGTTSIRARVPEAVAGRLLTYLHAYTNPRHATSGSTLDQRAPYDVRLGHAFCSLLEHVDPRRLPLHGGAATTVMVTIDLDSLVAGLGTAETGTGEVITASEARRLACTADLVPLVLGGASQPLDIGLAGRLFKPHQRRAMAARDLTCRVEGCDIPAPWCEAHHLVPWSRQGPTDLANGLLLCSHHHHRAHDPAYRHTRLPDGSLRFHRRT